MHILQLHTHYQQPGGEDGVFSDEVTLLRERGHEVKALTFHNRELEGLSSWRQASITLWNREAYRRVRETIWDFSFR
jgi:hypothetical protein